MLISNTSAGKNSNADGSLARFRGNLPILPESLDAREMRDA